MVLFALSATNKLPLASNAKPVGSLNSALVPDPLAAPANKACPAMLDTESWAGNDSPKANKNAKMMNIFMGLVG
jgi:hypothetical protein